MRPQRRPAFFRVIRFDRTLQGSENAVAYVAFRSEDIRGKTPCVFDAQHDHADVRSFMDRLEDRVTRHPSAAKAYHCLFSLKRADFDVLGVQDWREVVREVLRSYELQTRRRLDWIASHHPNPERPHCHVIIKATYATEDGKQKKLFLNRQEVDRIKETLARSLEARGLTPERPGQTREAAYRAPVNQMTHAVGGVLSWLEAQIQAERRRRAREEEARLRRQLREMEEDRDGR